MSDEEENKEEKENEEQMSRDRKPQRRSGHRHKEDLMRPQSNDFEDVDDAQQRQSANCKLKTGFPVKIKNQSCCDQRLVFWRTKTVLVTIGLVKIENQSSYMVEDWSCQVWKPVFYDRLETVYGLEQGL